MQAEMQAAVDHYLHLYNESKKLEEQLKVLRGVIEPYMKSNNVDAIAGSDGLQRIELTQQSRPVMTSRYSSYDVTEISGLLQPAARKKCVVEVVDKDKLEALCKLGELPETLLSHKVTSTTHSFSVRSGK